jgi:hypothetical protein
LIISTVACPGPPPRAPAPAITTGDQLVRAMHDRYAGTWYHTLAFVQRNTRYLPNGTTEPSTWLEALALPGKLRIDIQPLAEGSGTLFVDDTQYVIRNGAVTLMAPGPQPLFLLGFDVYFLPPERTAGTLRTLGFDLARLHEATWEGRPVYVVGAAAGDTKSKQFWVDRERLLFVRMLQPAPQDTSRRSDIRFEGYRPLGGGWIAPEVVFLLGDQRTFVERYEELRVDLPLDPALFDPKRWRTAPHWHPTDAPPVSQVAPTGQKK